MELIVLTMSLYFSQDLEHGREKQICGNPDRQDKVFFERVWWFLLSLKTIVKFPLTSLGTKICFFVSSSASSLSSFICMSSTLSHPYAHFIEYFVSQTACLHLWSYCTGPTVKTFYAFQKYNKKSLPDYAQSQFMQACPGVTGNNPRGFTEQIAVILYHSKFTSSQASQNLFIPCRVTP